MVSGERVGCIMQKFHYVMQRKCVLLCNKVKWKTNKQKFTKKIAGNLSINESTKGNIESMFTKVKVSTMCDELLS